jgi:Fe-S-cluster containining protein
MQNPKRTPNLTVIQKQRSKRHLQLTGPKDSDWLEPENPTEFLRLATAKGLRYCHQRVNANTSKSLENASFLYALVELLAEKGMLRIEELDERKKIIAERLVENFKEKGLGLMYQDPEIDKYSFDKVADIDCSRHTAACKAICCKFPFALSRQDIEEGRIKWDFGQPYLIAHDEDGYCAHLNRETFECTVREYRPVPCRGFDCRNNRRWKVWQDFDRQMVNTELVEDLQNSRHPKIGRDLP